MNKWILVVAALLGATAVMSGAFGAHALQSLLDERATGWYQTAVTYHSTHALALLAVGILALLAQDGKGSSLLLTSGICLIAGTIVFSGSLYAMAFTGITKLGMITPIGGALLILGWLFLAMGAARLTTGVSLHHD